MRASDDTEPVACRDLVCGYGGAAVTAAITLSVRRGEVLAILGGSGSGKSTLLRTLLGLLPPLSGSVRLLDADLATLEGAERQALYLRIGALFQSDALLGSLPVIDNVTLPLRELLALPAPVNARLARARLALLGVAAIADSMPSKISGGQAKRVALARASILDPELLFCDEPTAGLDPQTANEIDRTLLSFRDLLGTTIVAITHDVDSVRAIADRAVVLAREGILAEGSPKELEEQSEPRVRGFFERAASSDRNGKAGAR